MEGFFWTGFYLLREGHLRVGPYQGPLACQELEKDRGVCWAGINENRTIIVPDVEKFPGHIACDSRSRSEIVVPLRDAGGRIIGVLDVDSRQPDHFDSSDARGLERIVSLVMQEGAPGTVKPTG
jgi:L-methionine (R)-S-oxide reductase